LIDEYYQDGLIRGPDPGLGLYLRGGRFLANHFFSGKVREKKYVFQQTQAYFIKSSLILYRITNDDEYKQRALEVGDKIVEMQNADGSWPYPIREWRDRTVTVDCNWAAMGLLDLYLETKNMKYLAATQKWIDFLITKVGYSKISEDEIGFRYFRPCSSGTLTPNVTTLSIALLARIYAIKQKGTYKDLISKGLNFIQCVIKPDGEIPYTILVDEKNLTLRRRIFRRLSPTDHYQCAQYHGFQLMDLCYAIEELGIEKIKDIVSRVSRFLQTFITEDGHVKVQCRNNSSIINYHTSVVGAALLKADEILSLGLYNMGRKAMDFVLKQQTKKGGFPFSQREYKVFSDTFEYPRANAFILYHLLMYANHFTKIV
jgi:hypothetical protein